MSSLPDLSLALFERVFPRTLLALEAGGKTRLARELAKTGWAEELSYFPAALAERKWESDRGFAPDLASLEYALRLAGMAPEIEERGFEGVASATEPDWYAARFRFVPGHRLLDSDWPLEEVYARPQDSHERRPGTYLIFRGGGKAQFRGLSGNEEALVRSLALGVPLGQVLERRNGPDFDAFVFHRWIESGFLRAIDWAAVKTLDSVSLA